MRSCRYTCLGTNVCTCLYISVDSDCSLGPLGTHSICFYFLANFISFAWLSFYVYVWVSLWQSICLSVRLASAYRFGHLAVPSVIWLLPNSTLWAMSNYQMNCAIIYFGLLIGCCANEAQCMRCAQSAQCTQMYRAVYFCTLLYHVADFSCKRTFLYSNVPQCTWQYQLVPEFWIVLLDKLLLPLYSLNLYLPHLMLLCTAVPDCTKLYHVILQCCYALLYRKKNC